MNREKLSNKEEKQPLGKHALTDVTAIMPINYFLCGLTI